MRVVYMGTPDFAVPTLKHLAQNTSHTVVSVVTTEDKPKGRGRILQPPAVKLCALDLNIPVLQPNNLRDTEFHDKILTLNPDVLVVVVFRILPVELFSLTRFGAINLHASLLPSYRGPAPVQWAIMNGEQTTGLTTFQIDKGIDTGNILMQRTLEIEDRETAGELLKRLADIGAQIVAESLDGLEKGEMETLTQVSSQSSYAPKITPDILPIEWNNPAQSIVHKVRGLSPSPCAQTYYKEKLIKLFRAQSVEMDSQDCKPGTIVKANSQDGLFVQAGSNVVEILELQREGRKQMTAKDMLRGMNMEEGEVLRSKKM